MKLVKSTGKKVYFLSGHNERGITPRPGEEGTFAAGPESFGRAADALVNETYAVEPLLVGQRGRCASGCLCGDRGWPDPAFARG